MKEYTIEEFNRFEDLPFISNKPPNLIREYQSEVPQEIMSEYINKNYQLILQTPVFPSRKNIRHLEVMKKNQFFNLVRADKFTFNNLFYEFLEEIEYVNGYNFFLIKNVKNPVFKLPLSSRDMININNLTNNHIVFVQIESYEVREFFWN